VTRTILVGEVRTGRRIATIPVSAASFSTVLKGIGTVDATIPLAAEEFKAREKVTLSGQYPGSGIYPSPTTYLAADTTAWRPGQGIRPEFLTMIEPNRCFMAVVDGDTICESGPIVTHNVAAGAMAVTVGATNWRGLFDRRRVMAAIDSGWAAWAVTYSGLSLGTVMKRLVQLAMSVPGGDLPIVLPDDLLVTADDFHTRTYKGSELGVVNDRLNQISGVLGGPDIAFEGRFTADHMGVEVVMRTGTEVDPMLHQAGADRVWDLRVPRGSVRGLAVSRDGSGVASTSWVTGNTTAGGLLMSRATSPVLTDDGFPLLEVAENRATVETQSTLDGWAAGDLAGAARPVMMISMSTNAPPGDLRPGDFGLLWPPPQHYLGLLRPDAPYRVRLASMGGILDPWTDLTFLPTPDGGA
jgi:hypothetical protein